MKAWGCVLVVWGACNGPSAEEECAQLERDAIQSIAANNSCARHEDCALYTSKPALACKGLGHSRQVDPKSLESVAAFERKCAQWAARRVCSLDYVTTFAPCRSGRCVDDVNGYTAPPDAGPADSGR